MPEYAYLKIQVRITSNNQLGYLGGQPDIDIYVADSATSERIAAWPKAGDGFTLLWQPSHRGEYEIVLSNERASTTAKQVILQFLGR